MESNDFISTNYTFKKTRKKSNILNIFFNKNIFVFISIILFIYFGISQIRIIYLLKELLKDKTKINELKGNNTKSNIDEFKGNNTKSNIDEINNRIKILKMMTNNNPLIYKGPENCLLNDPDAQLCLFHLIYPKKVVGKNRILVGQKSDGCYVLLDDFENIKIAYSFGISVMIQFDDYLANKGIDVYMYDHTINGLKYNHPKFHWKKIGICGNNERTEQLKTLEDLIKENGHTNEKNMILKIDVEHAEWNALNDLKDEILTQFKYIVIEFHFLKPESEAELYYKVLKKIKRTHQVFYHRCHGREHIVKFGNNFVCKYLELSYIIRDGNNFTKDDSFYPNFEFDFHGPGLTKPEVNLNILKLFDFDND